MNHPYFFALLSVGLVSLVSLVGVVTLALREKALRQGLIFFVSFSAGALFGDAFLHLLPEAVAEKGFSLALSFSLLSGIVLFFIIEKVICWRHCHLPISADHPHPFALMNLMGDSVHNFVDGLIIGASYFASTEVGLATTIAVIAHEIPQELGDFGVLLHGNFSKKKALLFNFLTALTSFLGVICTFALHTVSQQLNVFLLPFSAGSFIYIAGTDLIPELHKEVELKVSLQQLFFFLVGIAMMAVLLLLQG